MGTLLRYTDLGTLEGKMPLRDEEVKTAGIEPREHAVRRNALSGRAKYPFKYMVLGDYFVLVTHRDAMAARDALKSFYRRDQAKKFSVRQRTEGEWICRRVA